MYIILTDLPFYFWMFFHYLEKCKMSFYYYNEKVDGIDSNDSCDNNKYITT